MTQHRADGLEVDAAVEPARGRGVSERVDASRESEGQRVAVDEFVEPPAGEGAPGTGAEQGVVGAGWVGREVGPHRTVGRRGDRDEPLVAELAGADEDEIGPDVADAQVAELGGTDAARAEDGQRGTIAEALGGGEVGSEDEVDHLALGKEFRELSNHSELRWVG